MTLQPAQGGQRFAPGRATTPIDAEIRRLVRTMAQDGWGAPRIHAELTKLGFIISESTVSRYLPRRPAEPDQLKRWMAFLRNHKDDIAAMDLFTVPTASLRLLYVCSAKSRSGGYATSFLRITGMTFTPSCAKARPF